MKLTTVYVLWNYDTDEPMFSSTDKSAVEEIMCDLFMEDAYEQFCWETVRPYFVRTPVFTPDRVKEIAKDAFDGTMEWYDSYMGIIEINPVWD